MTHMTLQAVRQLIANDSYAITFQSVEQYRATLLRHFDSLVDSAPPFATGGVVPGALNLVGEGLRPLPAHAAGGPRGAAVTLDEAVYALDLVVNKMHVPGLSGQRAFALDVLKRAEAPAGVLANAAWVRMGDPRDYKPAEPLATTPSASDTPEAPADMRAAAEFIDKRAEQYLQDHASHEPDTGAVSFHYGEAGRDYHSTLVELADDLRKASEPAVCNVPPAGWYCTRVAGHEGPCAAVQRTAQIDGGEGEERSNTCRPAT